MARKYSRVSLKIVSIYALTGFLWILFSDKAIFLLTTDHAVITTISIIKGWAFVLFTSMILYWLIERHISEVRLSEDKLRASEETFLKAFTYSPVLMTISALDDGRYIEVNNRFTQVSGFSRQEAVGRTSVELGWISAANRESLATVLRRDGRVSEVEMELTAKDGRSVYCLYSGETIFIDGQPCLLSIAVDITERKQAEKALELSNERLEYLLTQSPAVIYTCKPSGDFGATFVSDNVRYLLGYAPFEFTEDSGFWINHVHPDDAGRVIADLPLLFEHGHHKHEYRFRLRDGSYCWVHDKLRLVKDKEGHPVEIIGYWSDITERKRSEQEISQYVDIVQNMQVGLYVYHLENPEDDRSLRLVAANPRSASMLGLIERDIIGRTIDEIFPELRQAGIPGKFADAVRTGQLLEVEEFLYSDQNIKEAAFAFKVFPLPDNRVGVLFEDITVRKNAEAVLRNMNRELEQRVNQRTTELNELNKELQAFNYSISHDMKAPLIRIKGYADILLETCATKLSEDELHYISRLKISSKLLDEHIEALLKLYQINRGDFYVEPVNLTDLSVNILNYLQDLDPDRKATLSVADGMVVNADKVLMKEFMDNLIGNAWKYTAGEEEPRIEIGVTRQDGRDVYFIRDNGVGFDMDQVDNIFAPFLRLHREDTGLGIGLASVQRIIRLHGGKIWAEGKEGEGAAFYFTMQPADAGAENISSAPAIDPASNSCSGS